MRSAAVALVLALPLGAAEASADAISRTGDVASILLPVGAAGGTLLAKDHRGLGQLAAAYASAMGVVYVTKPLVDRTRPDGGGHSFPSGHATSAFAGAAFLQRRYGWRLGVPAYAVASFVGYSRVESRRHHTTDVIAGAVVGIAANLVFTHPRDNVSLAFAVGRGHAGSSIVISW